MRLVEKRLILRGDLLQLHTSKFILLIDFIVAIGLAIVVIVGSFLDKDMSNIATITAFWDAQMTAAVGFYYWKAKNENRSKHAMQLVKDLAEKYGIENVARLAEIILKD